MAVVWNWLLPPISVFVAPKHKWHYQKPGWRQCWLVRNAAADGTAGRSLVKELVFTGEPLDAQRALSCGLVNRVVAVEALHDAGLQLAQRIAQRTPVAVQIAKQVIDAGEGIAVASTLEALAGAFRHD